MGSINKDAKNQVQGQDSANTMDEDPENKDNDISEIMMTSTRTVTEGTQTNFRTIETQTMPKTILGFPKPAFLILGTEFCERFSYYGMRAVFTLFVLSYLGMSKDHSVHMFHTFIIITYSSSVIGAMISDGHWGKYDTIFRFGVVFLIGYMLLTLGANPWFGTDFTQHWFAISVFMLIGIAAGAIKPRIAPFGADQFTPEHDQGMKEIFFDVFYFSINIGAAISSIVTPMIRDTTCYNIAGTEYEGDLKYNQCFSLAFFVPFLLMALALLFF